MKTYKKRIRQKTEGDLKQNQFLEMKNTSHQKLKPNGCTYHMCTISELEDGYEYPQCSEGLKAGKYEGDFKRHGMEILKGASRETEGETI